MIIKYPTAKCIQNDGVSALIRRRCPFPLPHIKCMPNRDFYWDVSNFSLDTQILKIPFIGNFSRKQPRSLHCFCDFELSKKTMHFISINIFLQKNICLHVLGDCSVSKIVINFTFLSQSPKNICLDLPDGCIHKPTVAANIRLFAFKLEAAQTGNTFLHSGTYNLFCEPKKRTISPATNPYIIIRFYHPFSN